MAAATQAYLPLAVAGFRRWSAYRSAMLAGLVTNVFFGFLNTAVIQVVFASRPGAGGYDVAQAVTYVWVAQGLIGVIGIWGGTPLALRIRSGDVAVDLLRPWSWHGALVAEDVGRAGYMVLVRGLVPVVVAASVYGITLPSSVLGWIAALVAVPLAVLCCFGLRLLIQLSAFWLLDHRGIANLWGITAPVLSGLVLPIALFPEWARTVLWCTPFPALLGTPSDLMTGRLAGADVLLRLGHQVLWVVVVHLLVALVLSRARHRVVVQGG